MSAFVLIDLQHLLGTCPNRDKHAAWTCQLIYERLWQFRRGSTYVDGVVRTALRIS